LKLKDAELVETYYKWTNLLQKMSMNKCHGCVKLEEHMKLAREIKKHKTDLKDLEFQMSDEALLQMPAFQGRVRSNEKVHMHLCLLFMNDNLE